MQSGSCAFNWADNSQYPGQAADSPWVPQSTVQKTGKDWATSREEDLKCKPGQAMLECLRAADPAVLVEDTLQFTQPAYGGTAEAAEVQREYPLAQYGSTVAAWTAVTTDRIWSCTQVANDQQAARKVPVYAYEFADKHSPLAQPGQGAAHAVELPYLFRLGGYDFPMSETQKRLATQMIDYWTAFARTGDPNGPGRPHWAPAGHGDIRGLSLAPTDQGGIKTVALSTEHHCDFWTGL
jgi:para-nitrobenzyl esterase